MGKKIILFALFLAFFVPSSSVDAAIEGSGPSPQAQEADEPRTGRNSSGLPIPRFVALAAEKVFVRTGPALRYPIKWVYQRENMPVEVIQEFDTWRKIRDMDGDTGWVHQSLLSGDRTAVVKGEVEVPIRREPEGGAPILALLEPQVVPFVEACAGAWCRVASEGYKGWVERKFLWGIYDTEEFD